MNTVATDQFWEQEIYAQGRHLNRYPFDEVVSFVNRWRPRDKPRADCVVVEVGCGAGNNLWFAAREGFRVAGIDGSASAIDFAQQRFAEENLQGDLRVGDFSELPWPGESFELAIDRCSLTCVGRELQRDAVAELHRVLRPGGLFFHNTYSDEHSSARAGVRLEDGRMGEIDDGTLIGAGGLCFSSRHDVEALFARGWDMVQCEHLVVTDVSGGRDLRHAEWRIIARKQRVNAAQSAVTLRPAKISDSAMVFGWRNLPAIVALATSQRAVGREEHDAWFAESVRGDRRMLCIVEENQTPAGQVRFDWVNPQEAEISIYLLPERTGRGLGVQAIRESCKAAWAARPVRRIVAWVREENVRSVSAFQKAGFHLHNDDCRRPGHVCLNLERSDSCP